MHCIILISFVYSQKVLFDDIHSPHPADMWQDWIDSLTSHGIVVEFATDVGLDIDILLDFDMLWEIDNNPLRDPLISLIQQGSI